MENQRNLSGKKVLTLGFVGLLLLIIAKLLVWMHLPNGSLFIVAGILFFNLAALPFYLIQQIGIIPTQKTRHWLMFLSSFIFNISFFLALQQEFVPLIISSIVTILTGLYLIWYFTQSVRSKRINLEKFSFIYLYVIFIGLIILNVPFDVQAPDYQFKPMVQSPAYIDHSGPVILIDQAHNNIHTLDHRLISTGILLENDGYKIKALDKKIETGKELEECKIYVIVNALSDQNLREWKNPTYSAFTDEEISNINDWVFEGGSLLLIVDHMPLPGAAYDLAKSFGFELRNGHVKQIPWNDNWFYRTDSSLSVNVLTNGRNKNEMVDSVLAYGGSAFLIPDDATSIMVLDSAYYQWEPDIVWDFKPEDRYSTAGYSMGAYKSHGKGKVVVYSEAMMFTAQLGGGFSWIKLGMNSKKNPKNYQLLLNTIHWLDPQVAFSKHFSPKIDE